MTKVFLSHSPDDRVFVERLAFDLHQAGIEVWYDGWEIQVGDSIVTKIGEGLQQSSYLAIVLSQQCVRSQWAQRELNSGLMNQLERRSMVVLPILLDDCEIPALLLGIQYADFRKIYKNGLDQLMRRFRNLPIESTHLDEHSGDLRTIDVDTREWRQIESTAAEMVRWDPLCRNLKQGIGQIKSILSHLRYGGNFKLSENPEWVQVCAFSKTVIETASSDRRSQALIAKLGNELAGFFCNLGMVESSRGNLDDAITLLRLGLTLDDHHPFASKYLTQLEDQKTMKVSWEE